MVAVSSFPTPKMGEKTVLLNPYQVALEHLAPLESLLSGFNRRNKSQHRRARWWASFNMLRRGLTKFLLELLAAAKSRAANSLGTLMKSGKPKKYEDQHLVDRANERARWMRDALLHKCYLQFSQLTADNQFATLGVVLLGVLGQVRVCCCRIVGEQDVEDNGERDRSEMMGKMVGGKISREAASFGGSTVARDVLAIRQGGEGGGVISREDAAARSAAIPRRKVPDEDVAFGESDQEQDEERLQQETKSAKPALTKRKRDEVNTSYVQSEPKPKTASDGNSDAASSKNEPQSLIDKKMERENATDNFSAIFAATSFRPSKKIKRPTKQGDYSTDDIFAPTATTRTKSKSNDKEKLKVKTKAPGDGSEQKKKKKKAGKRSEFDDLFSSLF